MEKIIEVKGLNKSFGGFHAVNNLDMDVFRGDVFGFLGPNGAGKSTTIRMLLTLIKPDSGSIKIFGKDIQQSRNEILRNIGCIVEKPDFYKFLSARKNIDLFASLSGIKADNKRIDEIFELVGLRDRAEDKVKAYSHGMKQRLGLAQALIHDPELIILDEPTTGLDPQGIIDIRNLILHLKDKGKTVFLSSHILSELELIATRMAIINKGKTVVQGDLKTLLHDDDRVVVIKINRVDDAKSAILNSQWKDKFISVQDDTLTFQLHLDEIPLLNSFFVENGFAIYSIESKRKLEDFFLNLTESAERMIII